MKLRAHPDGNNPGTRNLLQDIRRLLIAWIIGLLAWHASAYAGSFVADFNSGLPAGTILYGNAQWMSSGGVNDSGMVSLTNNVNSQTGYFIVSDLDAGQPVTRMTVDFNLLVGGGTNPPADGLSFNFANDLPGSPGPLPVEEGVGTGLSVCFDSFDNGGSEAPAVEVRWNGSLVSRALTPVSRGDTYFPYHIALDPDGSVDVTTWNQGGAAIPIFSNLATGYTPISGGQFAFAARTGALTDNHWIDDLSIQTEPAPRDEAYYSLAGWFAGGSETQSILFSLQSSISAANNDPFSLRTWQNSGGTNAAGDVIDPGGFDPVLSLYKIEGDGSASPVAMNDDHFGLDSQITWGTSGLTELPFGDYRLDLTAYGNTLAGRQRHWAVDLVGKSADLAHGIGSVTVLSGIDRSGITTLKSLKFGATENLLGAARVNIASGEALVVSGDFVMRDTGRAATYVDNGALVAGRVHISPGTATYLFNGGTVSTSELVVAGLLSGTGAVILPDAGILRNQGRIEIIADSLGLFSSTIVLPGGHYVQESGGVLDIGIGGAGLADYGRLTILNGTAQLAGLLNVELVGSFVPSVGQSYQIITSADGFLTTFDPDLISLPGISGTGLGWDVAYHYGPDGWSMVLTTIALGAGSSSGAEYAVPEPGSLTLIALAAAIGLVCRSLRRVGRHLGMVMLLFVSTTPAGAGDAYWSFEGWFADGSETQSFFFDVPYSDITSSDPFSLRTWQNGGGYNAAGDYVIPAGFDPVVGLFDGANNLVVANDDRFGLDSGIGWGTPSCTWGQFPSCAGTWNAVVLPPDSYRMDLAAFGWNLQNRQSHWAVDLVGPVDRMWLTGVGHNGVSTLKSLKFGTADPGFVASARIDRGQSLVMSGDLVVGENAVMNNAGVIAAGRVQVDDSGWLTLNDGTVSAREMVVNFALEGTGDVILTAGGSLQNHGTVQPGHWWYTSGQTITGEGGAITIPRGNYEQTERFRIYIGGKSPTQYGQLHVFDGSASLGGLLLVGLVDIGGGTYFAPAIGDAFEILTATAGFQGTKFDDFDDSEAPLAPGLKWNVRYTPTSVVLEVISALAGDYNQNGVVDAADYTIWRDTLGSTTDLRANGDNTGASAGVVDGADYLAWKSHFGMTAGSGASVMSASGGVLEAAIPEPATGSLLVALGAILAMATSLRSRGVPMMVAVSCWAMLLSAPQQVDAALTGHCYNDWSIVDGLIDFSAATNVADREDPNLDYWDGSPYHTWRIVPGSNSNFGVEWNGFVRIELPGQYGFGTISDDGSQVWIDEALVVDNYELQWYDWEDNISEGDTSGVSFPPLVLAAGYHPIRVRWYEQFSFSGIELWWLTPAAGASDIPYYGENFHGINPTYNPNTNWVIVPASNLFTAVPALAGDYNQNGIVDAADYTVWRDTLGSTTDLRANGDDTGASAGVIDQADYAMWKLHFGQTAGSGSLADPLGATGSASVDAAVPEPTHAALLPLGGLLLLLRRRPRITNWTSNAPYCRLTARIALFVTCCVAFADARGATSTFDVGDEGWSITGDAQGGSTVPTYHATGGNPGGYVSAKDNVTGGVWYFKAPVAFRGDYSAAYGTDLTFDLRQSGTNNQFDSRDIYLRGGGLELLYYFRLNGDPNPGTTWTTYSVPLVAMPAWLWNDGSAAFPPVTEAQMRQVLSDVTDLQIRGEYITGADTGDLDNVSLIAATLLGDYNQNGTVDAADYTVWRDTLGSTADLRANGDDTGASLGVIDQADYEFWKSHFGAMTGGGAVVRESAPAGIPEPTTAVLNVFAIGLLIARRRPLTPRIAKSSTQSLQNLGGVSCNGS